MSTTLKEANPCPNCGGPLPSGALAGLCPACLLAQGFPTDAGGPEKPGRFEAPPSERIAALFPLLEVVAMVGTGGMGAVYKARQPALGRWVALKVLPADGPGGALSEERFNREARALARLSHPNIVGVHEFGQVGGLHYFIMEFVDGANLRQLGQAGRLSPREALQIIPQICDALQYAHDEGVVHRDIKPENVLVDRKGRVKIADFGLAKLTGQDPESHRLTVDGQVMGTPHYMAPEQLERPLSVDHRADIYSLGVVFYELLTGDLPLGKFLPPSRKVQVDVRLDDIVLRALENDPARRYQHASEVKSGVETVTNSPGPANTAREATAASSPAHREEPPRATRRAVSSGWHAVTPALVGFVVWLLVVVTTAFVTATLPQMFAAIARVQVGPPPGGDHRFDPILMNTAMQQSLSLPVLEQVAVKLRLPERWAWKVGGGPLSAREAASWLAPMISVRSIRLTRLFEIECWSGSSNEAAEFANAVAEAVVEQSHSQPLLAGAGAPSAVRFDAVLIDRAAVPLRPLRPNMPANLLLGLLGGGVLGGIAALFVGLLRRRAGSSSVPREEASRGTGPSATSWWRSITPALAGFMVWLLVVVTTAFVTAALPQWFNATARVVVNQRRDKGDVADPGRLDPYDFAISSEVLKSHTVLERAADRLKLQEKWAGRSATGQLSLREAGDLLRSMVEVRQFRNTAILEVTTWSGSANEAAELANAVAAAFVDQTRLQRDEAAWPAGVVPTTRVEAEVIDSAQPSVHALKPNVPLNLCLGLVVGGVSGSAAALFVGLQRRRAGIAAPTEGQRRSRLVVGAAVLLIIGVPFVVILNAVHAAQQADRQRAFAGEKAKALARVQKAEPTNSLAGSADTFLTILTPDGRPATGAEVAMVRSGEFATLVGERFSDADLQDGRRVQTYNDGRFRLPLDDRLDRVFAVHASGFAEAKPGQLAGQTHWALQPWGRIEGRLTSGDQPVVGRDLAVEPLEGSEAGPLRFGVLAFKTETDPDGHFRFEHVTPGRVKLTRFLRTDRGNGNVSWAPGRSTEVEVRQGEVTTVALGVSGHRLTGRLVWPAGPKLAPHWRFMGIALTPIPGPPAGVGGDPVAFERWRKSPEQQKLIKAAKQFNLAVLPDDTLCAEDLEPGTYRVDFFADVDWTTEADGHLKAEATADPITITVPAEPATGTIDIGVVTLRLLPPRPR